MEEKESDGADDTWRLPMDSRRPKPEVVEDKLDALINVGLIERGKPLPSEHDLARRFGVGRSSVRTALQRLQLRGIVMVEHGVGWRVTDAPPPEPAGARRQEAERVVEARVGLEPNAARLAAKYVTDRQLRAIEVANDEHAAAVRAGDVEDMIRTDEQLHRLIIRAADNDVIEKMYDMLEPRARAHRRTLFERGADITRQSIDGHALVVQFLRHRDPSAAVAMESHIRTFAPR